MIFYVEKLLDDSGTLLCVIVPINTYVLRNWIFQFSKEDLIRSDYLSQRNCRGLGPFNNFSSKSLWVLRSYLICLEVTNLVFWSHWKWMTYMCIWFLSFYYQTHIQFEATESSFHWKTAHTYVNNAICCVKHSFISFVDIVFLFVIFLECLKLV